MVIVHVGFHYRNILWTTGTICLFLSEIEWETLINWVWFIIGNWQIYAIICRDSFHRDLRVARIILWHCQRLRLVNYQLRDMIALVICFLVSSLSKTTVFAIWRVFNFKYVILLLVISFILVWLPFFGVFVLIKFCLGLVVPLLLNILRYLNQLELLKHFFFGLVWNNKNKG